MKMASNLELVERIENLSVELQVAKDTIRDLQTKLESRESELRVTKEKQQASFRRRSRRRKISSGLLSPPRFNNRNETYPDATEIQENLESYLQLTIFGYRRQASSDIYDEDDGVAYTSPTFVRMLQGKVFVIGLEGATIGSGSGCGVKVPSETGLHSYHSRIESRRNESTRVAEFYFIKLVKSKYQNYNKTFKKIPDTEICLNVGTLFSTGNIKWCVSAVPKHQLLLSKAFSAIREKSTSNFDSCMKEIEEWNKKINDKMQFSVTDEEKEALSKQLIGVSMEEDYNFVMCSDSLGLQQPHQQTEELSKLVYTEANQFNSYSLLHVAVDYGCHGIVKMLLEKNALVNLQCGVHNFTPLHLAAKHNDEESIILLIKFGSSLYIKDSFFETPCEKTEDSKIKKIFLNIESFCTACAYGDMNEVKRLLKEEPSCLEGKGYRNLTGLQVATVYGHYDVAEILLENKASPNITEPKNKRTALHLACLFDQVDVARLLLANNANRSITDVFGYIPVNFCRSKRMLNLIEDQDNTDISLSMAVQIGDKELVMKIIEDYQNENLPLDMFQYIPTGARRISRQVAMSRLGLSSVIDEKNERGMSPIHIASAADDDEMIRLLVCNGASVNLPGGFEKWTPLFYAAMSGKHEAVELLLSFGASRELCDARGMSCIDVLEKEISALEVKLKPTHLTDKNDTRSESLPSIIPAQYLIDWDERFFDMSIELCIRSRLGLLKKVLHCFQTNQQKLLKLLENEDLEGLQELLRSESNVRLDEQLSKIYPITALDYAASMGYDKIVDVLLTYNADPNSSDSKSYTPLHNAADGGHHGVVRVLLNDGVDVNLQTVKQQFTPLHIAAMKNHEKVVNVLLASKDIDVDVKDRNNKNAFQLTSNPDIQNLLARGSEHLYLAVINNDEDKLKRYLPDNNVNETFGDGETLLHVAASRDYESIGEILIDAGIEINAVGGKEKHTALHIACISSSLRMTRLLLSKGADLSVEDLNGRVPYEVTSTNEVRKLLLAPRKTQHLDEKHLLNDSPDESNKCSICLANDVNTIIFPCKHRTVCSDCVIKIDICPLDRIKISNVIVFGNLLHRIANSNDSRS